MGFLRRFRAMLADPPAPTRVALPIDPSSHPIEAYHPLFLSSQDALQQIDDLVQRNGLAVYRDMIDRDEQISACIALPSLARLSTGWKIVEAGGDEIDKEAAEFVRSCFQRLTESSVTRLVADVMDALPMGFSVVEPIWRSVESGGEWAGKQMIDTFVSVPQETIAFKRDSGGRIEKDGVWQATPPITAEGLTNPGHFDHLPRDRFIVWAWRRKWGYPFGVSILRPAYRWSFAKDQMLEWWLRYLEHHGMPFASGVVARGTTAPVKRQIIAEMKSMMLSHVGVREEGTGLELIQNTQHSAAVDAYQRFYETANRAIAKCCLLPPTVLDVGEGGSYALATAQKGTFIWWLDNLGECIADEVMREQVIAPLIKHNFGQEIEPPMFAWEPFDRGDTAKIATMFQTLHAIGFPLDPQDIAETLGVRIAADGEGLAPPSPGPAITPSMRDAAATVQEDEGLDALYDDLIEAMADPSRDTLRDVISGNGRRSRPYARDHWR